MTFAIALDRHFGEHETHGKQADLSEVARQFTRMSTGGFARDRTKDNIRDSGE
jgi:hypothetical protein